MTIPVLNPEPQIDIQARNIASRMNVGFDPTTILVIINLIKEVLPTILGCFKQSEQLSDSQVQMEAIKQHRRNPEKFERKIASRYRKQDGVTKQRSLELAAATIEELYSASSAQVMGCCAESPRTEE